MKTITILFSFLISFSIQAFSCGGAFTYATIEGPENMCPGSEVLYTVDSNNTHASWIWSCNNCEVLDPADGVWKTSYTHEAYSIPAGQISSEQSRVRFSITGASATISYSTTANSGTDYDSHVVSLEAPNSTAGSINGLTNLENCSSTQNTYTLSPTNSWERISWSLSSGLTMISHNNTSVVVEAISTSSTGTQYIYANMRWRDPSGSVTCNSKVITKSIILSGNPSSNNITIWTEGSNSANTICSNTLSLIDAFYVDNSIDVWEWNLPSNWTTSIYGDGSHVTVTSANVGGANVSVRAHSSSCGWTDWKTQYIAVEVCGPMALMTLSPNPASNEVTLLEKQDENNAVKKKNEKEYEIKFYENTSLKTKRSKVKVGDKINVSSLKKGSYIVHIIAPDESVIKTRLLIDK